MKIILPVSLNPISRRRDKSVKLSLETRELGTDEILTLMSMEGGEAWMSLAFNQEQLPETPEENADVGGKTQSERLRAVHYLLWKKWTDKGKYIGLFDTFRKERMEKIIDLEKGKLD